MHFSNSRAAKKLLVKLCILTIILFGVIEGFYLVVTDKFSSVAFTAGLVDKHQRAGSVPSPKIILIGGSNLGFGINSQMLEKHMGLPVANLAILAPLGIRFILSDADRFIKKDDIVILSFEYGSRVSGDVETQLSVVDYIPDDEKFVNYPDNSLGKYKAKFLHRLAAQDKFVFLLNESPKLEDNYSLYFRGGFNNYGDMISHHNNLVFQFPISIDVISKFEYEDEIPLINSFVEKFERRGAKVYFLQSSVAQTFFDNSKKAIEDFDQALKSEFKGKVLLDPTDSIYPDSSFYDSVFHLKAAGRDHHTQRLIKALQKTQN